MKPIRLTKGFDKSYKERISPNRNLNETYMECIMAFQNGGLDICLMTML
jgi:hypothetical protein